MGTDGGFSTGFGISNVGYLVFVWFVVYMEIIPILVALGKKFDCLGE